MENKTWVPSGVSSSTPKKPFVPFAKKTVDRPSKEERDNTQMQINRQSARRDAIDFLVAQNKPFTLEEVFAVADKMVAFVHHK